MRERDLILAALFFAVFVSTVIQLNNLAKEPVEVWDESYHAVVARNLLKHPLKPTLIDVPYLPYDYTNWHENHVWMHKPILPLWQIAGSFALFGVNRFTLRLPSLVLSGACILLTYAIGRRLAGHRAAAIAAVIQAAYPAMVQLVHGQWFADHVDVSLLFWTEVSVLFLLRAVDSGAWRDVIICGVAQGCAYLSKSYLALIVTGLSMVGCVLAPRRMPAGAGGPDEMPAGAGGPDEMPAGAGGPKARFRPRHALGILAAALATVAPWTIYAFVNYRQEFLFEYAAWWHHLAGEWENWGAPWQRVVFDYLPNLHQVFYAPVVVAAAALVVPAIRERSFGLLFTLAWVAGVFVPHFIAPTKTPTATLIAMPPLLILFGALIARALGGERWSLAAWLGSVAAAVARPAKILPPNRGYDLDPGLPSIAAKAPWLLWQIALAFAAAAVLFIGLGACDRTSPRGSRVWRVLAVLAAAATIWLLAQIGWASFKITLRVERNKADWIAWDHVELGERAREILPPNAVLLFEDERYVVPAMFHADRTVYSLKGRDPAAAAQAVRAAGGEPFLVTAWPSRGERSSRPAVFESWTGVVYPMK